jgi:hypothetical protein
MPHFQYGRNNFLGTMGFVDFIQRQQLQTRKHNIKEN